MAVSPSERGMWNSKLGFVLAAAGSAVGLGNIWRFPSEVAENGGAVFVLIYLACCFLIGYPVMVAELTIGRKTRRNPYGAFRALSSNPIYGLIGLWGILCGVGILAFYNVVAGWTFSSMFSEIFLAAGNTELAEYFANTGDGTKNAIFSAVFMVVTVFVVAGGVSAGIEKVAKTLMPVLVVMLLVLIGVVITREGAGTGLAEYLKPDFSELSVGLIFQAMGQAFFSLSLGMGALITYGSYLQSRQDIPEAAVYVTFADVGIAFIAGLLIIPSMYVAQNVGIEIFDEGGALIASDTLVFNVLPALFHTMGGLGVFFGVSFFLLLTFAALTSTISLLEVPTAFLVDETKLNRKTSAAVMGAIILVISIVTSYDLSWIGRLNLIFSDIGLPLGGLLISLFLVYVWRTSNALKEIDNGSDSSLFIQVWPALVQYVAPLLIAIVLGTTLYNVFA